jgi:hypothetical protein
MGTASRAVTCAAMRRAVAKPPVSSPGGGTSLAATARAAAGARPAIGGGRWLARGERGVMSGTMYVDPPGE